MDIHDYLPDLLSPGYPVIFLLQHLLATCLACLSAAPPMIFLDVDDRHIPR
jgi:hypothetical protein